MKKKKNIDLGYFLFEKDYLQVTKEYNSNVVKYQKSQNGTKNKIMYDYATSKSFKKIALNHTLKLIHHLLLNYLFSSQSILIELRKQYCKGLDNIDENNKKIINSLDDKINKLSFENEKLRKTFEENRKIL